MKPPYPPSEEQLAAVACDKTRVLVSAAAGSGKTGVIVERFMRAVMEKTPVERIVCITYTRNAARELQIEIADRLEKDGKLEDVGKLQNVTTIHGFCRSLLAEYAIDAGTDPGFVVLDEDVARLLQSEAAERAFEKASSDASMTKLFEMRPFDGRTGLAKNLRALYGRWRSSPGEPSAEPGSVADAFLRLFRHYHAEYSAMKRERSALDHDDLIRSAADALERDPVLAARVAGSFDLVLVDEYQDVNPLQARLLDLVSVSGKAFVVGDVRQSIYAFRHADCREFLRRAAVWPVKPLMTNYRSSPHIITCVNRLFAGERIADGEICGPMSPDPTRKDDQGAEVRILAADPTGGGPKSIEVMREREAAEIASEIVRLQRDENFPLKGIAVLLRAGTKLNIYEEALKQAGVRYHLHKGRGFYDQPEIEDVLRILRALARRDDDIAFASALKSPMAGLSDDALYLIRSRAEGTFADAARVAASSGTLPAPDSDRLARFLAWFDPLAEGRKSFSPDAIIDAVFEATEYDAVVLAGRDGRRCHANLMKLREKAAAYARTEGGSLERFVGYVRDLKLDQAQEAEAAVDSEEDDAVKVMTVHAAKGLEFEAVFVADLGNKGGGEGGFIFSDSLEVLPPLEKGAPECEAHSRARAEIKRREEEEEFRILYVALTRAKRRLYLTGARSVNRESSKTWMDWLEAKWDPAAIKLLPAAESAVAAETDEGAELARHAAMLEGPVPAKPSEAARAALARFAARDKGYFETVDLRVTEVSEFALSGSIPRAEGTLAESDEGRGAAAAAEFGTLYHRILQSADFSARPAEEITRLTALFSPHLGEADARRMKSGLERFFASPHAAALARAKTPFYRELPFLFRVTDGGHDLGFLSGQADLLYRGEDGWVLVDYKTGKPSDAHGEQIRLYAHCIGTLLGGAVSQAEAWYAEEGVSRPVDLAELRSGGFERRIVPLYARLREETLHRRMAC